jgi:hypothetical protein
MERFPIRRAWGMRKIVEDYAKKTRSLNCILSHIKSELCYLAANYSMVLKTSNSQPIDPLSQKKRKAIL